MTEEGPALLTAFIDDMKVREAFKKTLELLGLLQWFTRTDFFDEQQIEDYAQLARQFFQHFLRTHENINVTPKIHWLCTHVEKFIGRWKFWGLMSEQGIEALHRQVNSDERQYASVRKRGTRLEKFIYASALRNYLTDIGMIIE